MSQYTYNTDEMRATSQTIATAYADIESQATSLTANVSALTASGWIAPAADQFGIDVEEVNGQLRTLVSRLTELQGFLDAEIARVDAEAQNYTS